MALRSHKDANEAKTSNAKGIPEETRIAECNELLDDLDQTVRELNEHVRRHDVSMEHGFIDWQAEMVAEIATDYHYIDSDLLPELRKCAADGMISETQLAAAEEALQRARDHAADARVPGLPEDASDEDRALHEAATAALIAIAADGARGAWELLKMLGRSFIPNPV